MENLLIPARCTVPIFLMMAVGNILRRTQCFSESFFSQLNRFCFCILLPARLFYSIYTADFGKTFFLGVNLFVIAEAVVTFAAAYMLTTAAGMERRHKGAWLQNFYRSNLAVSGMALIQNLCGEEGMAILGIALTFLGPIYNILAVAGLDVCRGEKVRLWGTLKSIFRNPLVLASLSSAVLLALEVRLPALLTDTIESIGECNAPVAIIALGASLELSTIRTDCKELLAGSAVRLIVVPAISLLAAIPLGFRGSELGVILICAGSPLATTAYTMAQAYDSDEAFTAELVVATTLLCCITMFFWILLLSWMNLI